MLTLSGDNTYTGTTTVSAGAVALGAADRSADTSAVVVSNNATFNLAGFSETVASIATSTTSDTSAAITLGSGTLTAGGTPNTTFAGVISDGSDTGAFTKQGSGILTLSGANSFDGVLTISAGTVSVGAGSTVGTIATQSVVNSGTLIFNRSDAITYAGVVSGTGALQKSAAGTLTLSGANTYSGNTTINTSGGNITISGTGSLGTVTDGSAVYPGNIAITDSTSTLTFGSSTTQEFSGVISLAGKLTKSTGVGTLTLSGNNSYTGATEVSAGTIKITKATSLGNASGNTVVSGTGAVHINGATGLTVAEPFTISGNGSGSGALLNVANNNSVTSLVTLSAAATVGSTSGILTIDHATAGQNAFSGEYGLTVVGAGNVTVADPIATGVGTLTKGVAGGDTGTLTLSAANTYTGATSIAYGTVVLSNATSLGTTAGVTTVTFSMDGVLLKTVTEILVFQK
jgi:fibronectin-binding autotransporter adhesin